MVGATLGNVVVVGAAEEEGTAEPEGRGDVDGTGVEEGITVIVGLILGKREGAVVDVHVGLLEGIYVLLGATEGPTGFVVGARDRDGVTVGLVGNAEGASEGPLVCAT